MSISGLWQKLVTKRKPIDDRAEEAAKLTLPYLFTEEGHNQHSELETPYQSIGAMGVNTLSAKLQLTLFPPTGPFFRFVVEDAELAEVAEEQGDPQTQVKQQLSLLERAVQTSFERLALRPLLAEGLLNLLITGNGCFMLPTEGDPQFFGLKHFVVDRAPDGTVSTLIIRESIERPQASEAIKALLPDRASDHQPGPDGKDEGVCIYTVSERQEDGRYTVQQFVGDVPIPETLRAYAPDDWPFVVARFNRVSGEDYGRGLVEQYAGDLISAERYSEALNDLAALASRQNPLIRPGSALTLQQFTNARNGQPLSAEPDDLHYAQPSAQGALATVGGMLQEVEARLRNVFLMTTPRQAERVTAEEVRLVAKELQDTLGGTFSLMSTELQLPILRLTMARMRAERTLPSFPKDLVTPKVVTGIEGLGRNQDAERIFRWLADISQALGPEAVARFVNVPAAIAEFAAARGVPTELTKSAEQVQQEEQAAQQAQLAQQAVGPGIQAAAQLAQNQ